MLKTQQTQVQCMCQLYLVATKPPCQWLLVMWNIIHCFYPSEMFTTMFDALIAMQFSPLAFWLFPKASLLYFNAFQFKYKLILLI